jgi:hypothetical protein
MPKISGTRKELAKELQDRLTRGPSFSVSPSSSDPAYSPEEAAKQYKLWSESWILGPLSKLIPELKKSL